MAHIIEVHITKGHSNGAGNVGGIDCLTEIGLGNRINDRGIIGACDLNNEVLCICAAVAIIDLECIGQGENLTRCQLIEVC